MNIKPDPAFIPTPGKPTASSPRTHTVGGFGVWLNHRTLEQVWLDEEVAASREQYLATRRKYARGAYARRTG